MLADAHSAPTGWAYDSWCCGGQDCQPIPEEQVHVTPDGYLVTIPNGSHMTAHGDISHLFHYDEVRFSGDGEYHACIIPGLRRCAACTCRAWASDGGRLYLLQAAGE